MALTGSERWVGGFVVNDNGIVMTTSLAGAYWWSGFLRDPDGRLVIVYG